MNEKITVIGAGMAGVEASMMIARHGFDVDLVEMKPKKFSPAHQSPHFAELVCSNSFGSMVDYSAPAMLKEEMNHLHSVILRCAAKNQVPAGKALGVDREKFAQAVSKEVEAQAKITIIKQECKQIPKQGIVVVATGPMTSDLLAEELSELLRAQSLYFYDSISPIVDASSIDMDKVYFGSRYQMDQDDYLNCPMDKEQYEAFVEAIGQAEKVAVRDFEELKCFEGCQPVENLVSRGKQTLAFGPMKPVGLPNPKDGKTPYAVVQLRRENIPTTMYNLVGFQTRMKWGEQKRVFTMIPGLEKVEFVRMGSMHRNTYIDSPTLLQADLSLRSNDRIFFAGQLTGVEGYVESAAMGQLVGLAIVDRLQGRSWIQPPQESALGALQRVITTAPLKSSFSPMNMNFGLLPPLEIRSRMKKKERRTQMYLRGRALFQKWMHERAKS
ncbi:MAG: methylenetetrahydrofolate--tRNA-(uracil(54)-C(5))-methyltransferase (FADH(2)-oxidizing) TrmFO [Deltaproteobacteria bacterium]|nr:methylenetetrahydrofolate--tRNA-(uracil(54)-C(5))-methyltransferase (FADH(2)-oxidizing) TrmFO [Deltaproteobacteria bacterium]